jgi:hypothetical protein
MFTYKCLNIINICNTFIIKQLSHSSLFSKMILMPFVVLGKNLKQKSMCDKTILCCFWWWLSLYGILLSLLSLKYHNYVRYYPRLENYNDFYTPVIKKNIFPGVASTDTCFIQKIYAPSSSLLQGKHLPFTHTLQPAIWTTDAIGNSDHIYVTRNDR